MFNFNKVILMGRLVSDPEVLTVGDGVSLAKFTIVTDERVKRKGEWTTEPHYIDCSSIGKVAQIIGNNFVKGRPIMVEGHLRQEKWQDKQSGQNRSKLTVNVDEFEFVDSGNKTNDKADDIPL